MSYPREAAVVQFDDGWSRIWIGEIVDGAIVSGCVTVRNPLWTIGLDAMVKVKHLTPLTTFARALLAALTAEQP